MSGMVPRELAEMPTTRLAVYDVLDPDESKTPKEVAAAADVSIATVYRALEDLEEVGIAEWEQESRPFGSRRPKADWTLSQDRGER